MKSLTPDVLMKITRGVVKMGYGKENEDRFLGILEGIKGIVILVEMAYIFYKTIIQLFMVIIGV